MNGWRSNMEDAHVVVDGDHWGFFAVLDGHGGDMNLGALALLITHLYNIYITFTFDLILWIILLFPVEMLM